MSKIYQVDEKYEQIYKDYKKYKTAKDKEEFDKEGISKVTGTEYDEDGYNIEGRNVDGYTITGWNEEGEYCKDCDMIYEIYQRSKKYKRGKYQEPFDKESFLEMTSYAVEIDGKREIIKPTEEDVEKVIEYLKFINIPVSNYTVNKCVRLYKTGKINLQESQNQVKKFIRNKEI